MLHIDLRRLISEKESLNPTCTYIPVVKTTVDILYELFTKYGVDRILDEPDVKNFKHPGYKQVEPTVETFRYAIEKLGEDNVIRTLQVNNEIFGTVQSAKNLLELIEGGLADILVENKAVDIDVSYCNNDLKSKSTFNLLLKHSDYIIDKKIYPDLFFFPSYTGWNAEWLVNWIESNQKIRELISSDPEKYIIMKRISSSPIEIDALVKLLKIVPKAAESIFKGLKRISWWELYSLTRLTKQLPIQIIKNIKKKAGLQIIASFMWNKEVQEDPLIMAEAIKSFTKIQKGIDDYNNNNTKGIDDYNNNNTKGIDDYDNNNTIIVSNAVIDILPPNVLVNFLSKTVREKSKPAIKIDPDYTYKKVLPIVISNPEMGVSIKDWIDTLKIVQSNSKGFKTMKELINQWGMMLAEKEEGDREVVHEIISNSQLSTEEKEMALLAYIDYVSGKIQDGTIVDIEKKYSGIRNYIKNYRGSHG